MPVLKTLQRRKIRFIIPIPVRGKSGGMRTLFESASHKTTYTFNSPKHGQLEVAAVAVKKYSKGRYKRKGARWFAYAVGRLPKSVEAHHIVKSCHPLVAGWLGIRDLQFVYYQSSAYCDLPKKSDCAYFQILVDAPAVGTHDRSCS